MNLLCLLGFHKEPKTKVKRDKNNYTMVMFKCKRCNQNITKFI